MWNYIWPILIVIGANTFYNIVAKSTPDGVQPFASLTITYFTAMVLSIVMFFVTGHGKNFVTELHKANWTSFAFGCTVIALEFGYIMIYRAGWNVSVAPMVANIGLACVLVIVGLLLYKEMITPQKILGMILCIAGIIIINK